MRKSAIIISLLLGASALLHAQSNPMLLPKEDYSELKVLGQAFMRVEYEMTYRAPLYYQGEDWSYEFKEKDYLTDKRIVEIGDNVRKDYSYWLESMELANKQRAAEGKPTYGRLEGAANPFEIFVYRDSPDIMSSRTLMGTSVLRYELEDEPISWELTDEMGTVLGYSCQKATCGFGGRSYTAWYTVDIPVSAGPYRFDGLPGLILKISSDDGHYAWTATGIEKGAWDIYEKQFLFHECSREKAEQILRDMYCAPFKFLDTFGVKTIMSDGRGGARGPGEKEYSVSMYYDPIEVQ